MTMKSLHHALALLTVVPVGLLPVIMFLLLLIYLDTYRMVRMRLVLAMLAAGGVVAVACYILNGELMDLLGMNLTHYSRWVAPIVEETLKACVVLWLFGTHRVGFLVDSVILGFAVGAGFAVVENFYYLYLDHNTTLTLWIVRGFGTAVMHGTTLAILAAIAHEFAERETREAAADFDFNLLWFVPGYLIAVGLHMAFNQFPDRPLVAMLGAWIVAPIALISIFHFATVEAHRWLMSEYSEHKTQLEALRGGGWPDTPAGRKIAAFAERLGPETTKRIRRYWELLAWLLVEAEETLIEEEAGDVEVDFDQVRAAFSELRGLRGALGRSTHTALKALMPFSRNDYWELGELRQRCASARALRTSSAA